MAVTVLLLLVLALSAFSPSASSDPVAAGEIAALLAFKRSISADPSALISGWDPAVQRHCEWRGVTCDAASGRVTGLNVTGSKSSPLAGALAVAVGNLTELRVLSLRHNAFSGEIPVAAVGALRHLEVLDLRYNNFSGKIPDEISYLPFLRVLDLAYNSLSGPIPEKLIGFSRLESVDLSFNQLTGEIKISPLSSCRFLTHLKLSSNFLVDKIPPEIGNCSNLQTLLLDRNILEDQIPADIGQITNLRILDVSRNSLTQSIPRELGNCRKLSVFVLTDLIDFTSSDSSSVGSSDIEEFNAFSGAIPPEILSIPSLEILWAPRANLHGHLPDYRNGSCSLKFLNLGQNYIAGLIPEWLGMCKNLSFLDLSSNYLQGLVPVSLQVQCMVYFNVSQNLLSGSLPGLSESHCTDGLIFGSQNDSLLEGENLGTAYSANILQNAGNALESVLNNEFVILHDFSWNGFTGSLPSFSLPVDKKFSYGLFLNNNKFNGSLSSKLFGSCEVGSGFAVNLSVNQISGSTEMLSSCLLLKSFEAANNQFSGPITSDIGNLHLLKHLDLRRNHLNGSIPGQLGELKYMEQVLLAGNNLSGVIPVQLGGLSSVSVLDLSGNSLSGSIPSSLAHDAKLELLLLDHNQLTGSIPPPFSTLARLTVFDVSFNNLSGSIPHFEHLGDCKFFVGNYFLQPCPDSNSPSPFGRSFETNDSNWGGGKSGLKPFTVAAVASASIIVLVLVVLVLVLVCRKRKFVRVKSLRRKVVVTFADAPAELTYDYVVRATGNFSIQNLIGTGGFGATYKAELVPGFLVAVKRLSIGRFQGLRQFDAEIRTLGRIRHKNLVTLIGYHMGEAETFLIYNYLSGGNLETFIRNMSSRNVHWHEIHKIAQDVAQALTYLHYSCVPRIVHRDIKPSNILLDEKLNAYLSDFGLARLLEVSETHATTDVAGTFGYVAPEYATTCRVSDKADVYSYGVVLLELMSGKRSLDPSFAEYGNGFTIVAWGRLLIQEERADELFSPTLWESGPKDKLVEMLRLALACTVDSISVRPSMKQVVMTLKELKRE
ncbi:LRR receptor-like serine/threonine-protein kinase RPK2 [Phoenix dactylifera]|uniref:non-specific serine/threonine protein kinase n=1 Tax=Phoenix dactylifera TaxID=42345 RepID=A0A8B7CDQ9_PHODC|nr:LRR receptor-like serine/threonine-protein kinase RPK2 [Phoenix dactylifera]